MIIMLMLYSMREGEAGEEDECDYGGKRGRMAGRWKWHVPEALHGRQRDGTVKVRN